MGILHTAPEHRCPLSYLTGPSAMVLPVLFPHSYWLPTPWRSTQALLGSFQPSLQSLWYFSSETEYIIPSSQEPGIRVKWDKHRGVGQSNAREVRDKEDPYMPLYNLDEGCMLI